MWFQSGLNTDGAHNPVTARKQEHGDILSLNTFPMISGYDVALERMLFVGEADPASLAIWEANVATHEYGMSFLKPGISCAEVAHRINDFLNERNLLQYRTFGYGHSFGVLSHYYVQPGAGGYCEREVLIITDEGNENNTGYPYGPEFNIVG